MTDYHKKIASQYDYSGYTLHFKVLHQFAGLVKMCCLLLSVAFSTFFFKSLATSFAGEYDIYFGLLLSVIIAVTLHISTNKLIVYHEAKKAPFRSFDSSAIEPFILVMFLSASIGGITADFKGSPELSAHFIGSAPTDTTSASTSNIFQSQIEDIDAEVLSVEAKNFYWCEAHSSYKQWKTRAHICNYKENKRHVNLTVQGDLDAVEKIKALKKQKAETQKTMTTFIAESSTRLNNDISQHVDKLDKSKNRMQYASVTVTAIYLLLSIWGHKYGRETVKELKAGTAETKQATQSKQPETKEATQPEAKKKRKRRKQRNSKQYEKQAKQLNINADEIQSLVDAKFAEMLSENDDLLDEHLAMKDNEKRIKKQVR